MNLYGEELMKLGIGLLCGVIVVAVVFICIYKIKASKLKKQLEDEYGSQNL